MASKRRSLAARLGSWLGMTEPILQAGAIVVRPNVRGQPHVLVVTTRRRHNRWVLPKGSIERGERPRDAALREAREEAGVTGKVHERAGIAEYNVRAGRLRVEYFLIEFRREVDGDCEGRRVKWCSVEEAIQMLTYARTRRVLLEARPKIARLAKAAKR